MPQPEQKKRETLPVEIWVFVEHCELESGGTGVVFHKLSSEDSTALGDRRIFAAKLFRGVHPGTVCSIECDGNSCLPKTMHYIRQFADKEKVAGWEALDASRRVERQRKKMIADAKKHSALAEILEPVRKAYRSCPNRTAFECLVLRYLRMGDL